MNSYTDPFGHFGNMPEIPEEEMSNLSPDELQAIGCLRAIIVGAMFAVALAVVLLMKLVFHF